MKNEEIKMKNEGGMSRVVCRISSIAIDYNRTGGTGEFHKNFGKTVS
ncbi:MAG: hypothetical protein IKR48_06290 [Kiritimatiellae bacterium]|nr:hypothetical protein [Kiritimatiellia bacterium]